MLNLHYSIYRHLMVCLLVLGILSSSLAVAGCQRTKDEVVEAWVGRCSQGTSAMAMAVDADGNVYVTGRGGPGSAYITVKYDGNGNEIWVARYPAGTELRGGIAVDGSGNVYVTVDSGTVKYNSSGNEVWVAQAPGNAIALGTAGNAYVTGDSGTTKYDSAGNEAWTASTTGSAIAVDPSGNAYVTGDSGTVKYNSSGDEVWAAQAIGNSVALDVAGNVYVAGTVISSYASNGYPNRDAATTKYDSEGKLLWAANYGSEGNADTVRDMAVDESGNVYVTGTSKPFESGSNSITICYDSDGEERWVAIYDSPSYARGIALDGSGNIYVISYSQKSRSIYDGDYATVKYNRNGAQIWVVRYDAPGDRYGKPSDIVVDASGNVYVTGTSENPDSGYDYATVKYVQKTG